MTHSVDRKREEQKVRGMREHGKIKKTGAQKNERARVG